MLGFFTLLSDECCLCRTFFFSFHEQETIQNIQSAYAVLICNTALPFCTTSSTDLPVFGAMRRDKQPGERGGQRMQLSSSAESVSDIRRRNQDQDQAGGLFFCTFLILDDDDMPLSFLSSTSGSCRGNGGCCQPNVFASWAWWL
jgi:hypothetical protein